jgi:hypothetical protein
MTDPTAQPYSALGRVDAELFDGPTVVVQPPNAYGAHPRMPYPISPPPAPRPPADTSWLTTDQLEHAGELRRHRRKRSSVVPIILVMLTSLIGGLIVIGVVMHLRGENPLGALPFTEDSGVKACKLLAAPEPSPSVKSSKASFEQQADDAAALAKFRKLFSDSRYTDLRTEGVKLVDIMAQVVAAPDSALVYIGQFATSYASVAGACGAHGVPLPPLKS